MQTGLNADRVTESPTDLDGLEMDLVVWPHDRHAAASPMEDDRRRWNAPARPGGCDLEVDVDEHAGKQAAGRVRNVDLAQQGPCSRIERARRAGDEGGDGRLQLSAHRHRHGQPGAHVRGKGPGPVY